VERFGISRMTANRALRELTAEGVLSRVPGVGTFVREAVPKSSLLELRNIADEIAARGHRHTSRIELRETVTATPALAEEFEWEGPARLYHLLMVHEENGVPVQIEDRHVNPAAAPGFGSADFASVTPTAYLVAEVPVDELEHTVEAAMPNAEQRRLLGIGSHEPCLVLHRRSWSGGRVVTVATLTYPASRYALYSRMRTSASGTLTQ
jgi:GntR family histidine utilization transcriptional repressor